MATGKKKSNKKRNDGPDVLTIAVVVVAIVLVLILLVNYKKSTEGEKTPSVTPTVVPTATIMPGAQNTPAPTNGAMKPSVDVPKATTAPGTEGNTPLPTQDPMRFVEEAKALVQKNIDMEIGTYTIELLDDHLMIEGTEYYSFCINDAEGKAMEPLLIVEKTEGTLFCYDFSGVVSEFSKFPLDKTETGSAGVEVITVEEAKKVLAGYSGAALGLAKNPSEYDMTVDDWTTVIKGTDCYGINLFETSEGKQRFRGVFYVTVDGSTVYSADEVTGDFIER